MRKLLTLARLVPVLLLLSGPGLFAQRIRSVDISVFIFWDFASSNNVFNNTCLVEIVGVC